VHNQEDKNVDISVDKLVAVYIKMRDERDRLKRDMEVQIENIESQMKVINAELLDICKEAGVDSFRTPFGTAYRTIKSRYWTNDWESFHTFMKENEAMELLERRIHQSNMKQFLEENPDTHPAGLQVEKEYAITIRRK
jgi:enamine deaminase RidA (YjgF/YER057c/UK114 family)